MLRKIKKENQNKEHKKMGTIPKVPVTKKGGHTASFFNVSKLWK